MSTVTVAATQMACSWDTQANIDNATQMVRDAAAQGAQIILLQELFETPYFPIEQCNDHLDLARPAEGHSLITHFQGIAKELNVVLPISFFELDRQCYYNSIAMIDADGSVLGIYRKSHIPNFIGYQEKSYFTPGDTGFIAWETQYANIGVAICWDQWFPEAARCMVLKGAEMLLYPTAIGSEPGDPDLQSQDHWTRTMQGHAAANVVPVIASNRVGMEVATTDENLDMSFYGGSFIADHEGALVQQADNSDMTVLTHSFDLEEIRRYRRAWGLFRDRRPDLYGTLINNTPGH